MQRQGGGLDPGALAGAYGVEEATVRRLLAHSSLAEVAQAADGRLVARRPPADA